MTNRGLSRRDILASAASAAGSAWLATMWPLAQALGADAAAARDEGAAFQVLDRAEAADFAAIAACILPSDDLPGANEAGVVYFIDRAFKGFMAERAGAVRAGLQAVNQKAGSRFARLDSKRQVELLEAEEKTEFFGTMRFLTIVGMFAMPGHGGNRDFAGWKVVGFNHQHAWVPPFGYYDAAATGKKP